MRFPAKRTVMMMLMVCVFALALAVPASAADQDYVLWNPTTNAVSHANASVDGPAVVTGTPGNYTIVITLKNEGTYMGITLPASYAYLNANDDSNPDYEISAARSVAGGTTTFTISGVTSNTVDLPIQLQTTVAGFHNAIHELVIKW